MYICICHKINDRDIANSIAQGANNRVALMNDLGAGSACGRCVEMLDALIDAHFATETNEHKPILFTPNLA